MTARWTGEFENGNRNGEDAMQQENVVSLACFAAKSAASLNKDKTHQFLKQNLIPRTATLCKLL